MLFLGNLKLAMLVRRLSIRPSFGPGIYESESDTGNRVQHLAPAEVRALIRPAAGSSSGDANDWCEAYGHRDEDAMLAVLLCALPRLRVLELSTPTDPKWVITALSLRLKYVELLNIASRELGKSPASHVMLPGGHQIHSELRHVRWYGPEAGDGSLPPKDYSRYLLPNNYCTVTSKASHLFDWITLTPRPTRSDL